MFDSKLFLEASMRAVQASMEVVKGYQLRESPVGFSEIKEGDKTLKTIVDELSEFATKCIMGDAFPDARFHVEEAGHTKGSLDISILIDGLDGTRAFVNGLVTSTVIIGAYDHIKKQVVGCTIGEPISGRVWQACESVVVPDFGVWQGPLDEQATVLFDVSHGFNRGNRKIFTDSKVAYLFGNLAHRCKVLMPGSNGLHQALVAHGAEYMAGSITTAIGGPWDVCGVLLVLEAGGVACAFRMLRNSKMVMVDPLDVMSYDLLVCANNQSTLDVLVDCLRFANVH